MSKVTLPNIELFNPTLQALHSLGGSGTNMEIHDEVVSILGLADEQVQLLHDAGKSQKTEIAYRLSWTRTWLKRYGILENPTTGVWALTTNGQKTRKLDPAKVEKRIARKERERKSWIGRSQYGDEVEAAAVSAEFDAAEQWRETLYNTIVQMEPDAFERLVQRVLRESGFDHVEVTGRMGDGGIDGVGVFRIGGFLSFRVLFQCKRWKSPVGARSVRDFRGAMTGRTDKGLIVTTGNFSQDAVREARRDGALDIDLIDGEQLMDTLKELSLGVKTEQVVAERVTVNPDFFKNI
ncbi:MAG: restriction endonuclease [Chloroflexi bacterium]|nr:restriction endonuclease [Chloroflexota bacterium]